MQPESSSLQEMLSNLDVGWILVFVAILTIVRYKMVKARRVRLQTFAEYAESFIFAGVLVWMLLRPFAAQAYYIPSPSMEPTLFGENGSGDRIMVNKFTYRISNPQRDNVVVFIPPSYAAMTDPTVSDDHGIPVDENGYPVDWVKRLIALPGDTLEAHAGVIFVNGVPFDHSDIRAAFAKAGLFGPDCPNDMATILAEHHVKFLPTGVQIDGSATLISPTKLSMTLTGGPNAMVKIVPGYTTLNGQVLQEPFVAEDPDYDVKMYNGQPLKAHEPYKDNVYDQYTLGMNVIDRSTYLQDSLTAPGKIPAGQYFMMGDNRNDSEDSTEWGTLDAKRVIGRVQCIFWPFNRAGIIH